MLRAVTGCSLAGLLAALPALAPAQVAIGLGAGVAYGLGPVPTYGAYAPVIVRPYPLYGYGAAGSVYPPPRTGDLPSCYRVGRCTLADLYALGGRPDRLDRLAPTPPEPAGPQHPGRAFERPANVPPTAADEIQPGYRGTSLPRDEFKESGTPR